MPGTELDNAFSNVQPNTPAVVGGNPNSSKDFRKIWEEDIEPRPIDRKVLKRSTKHFLAYGTALSEETKSKMMGVCMKLNMNGYTMRTDGKTADPFTEFMYGATMNKEYHAPFKGYIKGVSEPDVKAMTDAHYGAACWIHINSFPNATVEEFNNPRGKKATKIFKALMVSLLLGKELNELPAFIIINTVDGNTSYVNGSDRNDRTWDVNTMYTLAKLFDITVYNVNNADSMQQLELILS